MLTTPDRPDDAVVAGIEAVLGAARVPAAPGVARPPRHHALHQRAHRAQGRPDRARHDQGLPRRGRDRPRAPLRHVRPLHAAAAAARAAPPPLRGATSGCWPTAPCCDRSTPARCGAWRTACAPAGSRRWRVPAPRVRESGPRAAGGADPARGAPGGRVSRSSSEVVPEIREYERTSTTLANVYVPALWPSATSGGSGDRLREARRRRAALHHAVERRASATAETARPLPVRLVESGPAAGALAAAHYGALARRTRTCCRSTWAAPPPRRA